jgi:hypothetical protein
MTALIHALTRDVVAACALFGVFWLFDTIPGQDAWHRAALFAPVIAALVAGDALIAVIRRRRVQP